MAYLENTYNCSGFCSFNSIYVYSGKSIYSYDQATFPTYPMQSCNFVLLSILTGNVTVVAIACLVTGLLIYILYEVLDRINPRHYEYEMVGL